MGDVKHAPAADAGRPELESLGLRTGQVAHDLNNYLTSILGHAGLALRTLPPDAAAYPLVESIQVASRRASELVAQILGFAGRVPVGEGDVDIASLVAEMTALLRTVVSRRAELRIDMGADPLLVRGDAARLRQVVMNLLTNAADALDGAPGTIDVRGEVVASGPDDTPLVLGQERLRQGAHVCLTVSDTGTGMSAETVGRIFDPFFTTKAGGHGLGLSAARDIVGAHGGGMAVESTPGVGTTFRVYLPLAPAAGRAAEAGDSGLPWPPADDRCGQGLILVVDDEDGVREFLMRALVAQGYDVILAVDGADGLDVFARHADRLAGVLLDLTMPRKGGEQVLAEINRCRPELPVVLMSGYEDDQVHRALRGAVAVAFLRKPFEFEDVLSLTPIWRRLATGTAPPS